MLSDLSYFKTYDIRGLIGENFDEEVCFNFGQSFAIFLKAKKIILAHDVRQTSEQYSEAIAAGILSQAVDVYDIGLCGTEEMYWATSSFRACGGLIVTASHNPIEYNGIKFVKKNSMPLDPETDIKKLKQIIRRKKEKRKERGKKLNCFVSSKKDYLSKITSFVDFPSFKPMKILVDTGNGCAGPIINELEREIEKSSTEVSLIKINNLPDGSFPMGIPNPMLRENRKKLRSMIRKNKVDFGVAFDGDFDRCFFFDENGEFIDGEFIVGLFARFFIRKEPKAKIVYEPRVIYNILDVVQSSGATPIKSRTGHAFMKKSMREHAAVYGGEISAHHYFRDFAFCDSGIIPFLLFIEIYSKMDIKISEFIKKRKEQFVSSGEFNFSVKDQRSLIVKVKQYFQSSAKDIDASDGLSMEFGNWRFNLRESNTEPLVRLNIESRDSVDLISKKSTEIISILDQFD